MKSIIYILFIPFFLISCKSESFEIENLNGNRIDVLGHAGMGISNLYPSNSAESILNCLNLGATGSEMDIQMTSDGVLVLYHNESLDGATNGVGFINSQTWDEIKNTEYDETPYSNYNLVRLSDLLEKVDNPENYIFTLDIKLYTESGDYLTFFDQYTDAIVDIFAEFNLYNHVFVESQSTDFLSMLQTKAGNIGLYYYPQTFEDGFSNAVAFNLKGISISTLSISKEQIEQAHNSGIFVTVWNTQSEADNIEAIHKNPDMIQTDRVNHLVKLLTEQDLIN